MLERELNLAISLARAAGSLILRHFEIGFETEEKIGVDNFSEPVTIADREASQLIVRGLEAEFPGDATLSEEEPDDPDLRLSRDRVWIIDPMDGTAGFVDGNGDFAVQIGLADRGRAVLGVVYQPFYHKLMYAIRGCGAFAVSGHEAPARLSVSDRLEPSQLTLAVSRNHLSPRMGRIVEHFAFGDIVRRGSVGLKVGLIAERLCDVYIHPSPRTKLWDTCGPQVIIEEAGGRLTDLFGVAIDYSNRDVQNHNGVAAANSASFENVITGLRPLLQEFGRRPHRRV